ncbi:MAG: hypothetical protein V3573_06440 [Desulfovibrionaceae bacterium]
MHLRAENIFKAFCKGHICRISLQGSAENAEAMLVNISPTGARLQMIRYSREQIFMGQAANLEPRFLTKTNGLERISSRVSHVLGRDVLLRFNFPLPLTSFHLCRLTRH